MRTAFDEVGDLIAELLRLAALLVFGAHLPEFAFRHHPSGYVFAALALLAVRPAALGVALARSGLAAKEWATAAWLGPKGFASVVYGLLILDAEIARSVKLFHLVAVVVAASIIAYSSSDVLVARWMSDEGLSTRAS